MWRSKSDIYQFFVMKKQKYLPPYKETKMGNDFCWDDDNALWLGFLKQVLKGEKLLLR
jgi:hypothetical protein